MLHSLLHGHVDMWTYVCMCVLIFAYISTHKHTHMHACMQACVYVDLSNKIICGQLILIETPNQHLCCLLSCMTVIRGEKHRQTDCVCVCWFRLCVRARAYANFVSCTFAAGFSRTWIFSQTGFRLRGTTDVFPTSCFSWYSSKYASLHV